MNVLGARSGAVNASPTKFGRYYSTAPIDDGERGALLQWAHCYWHPDALTAYAETDGWEGCADLVLNDADVLRHVIAHERALLEFTKLEIAGRGAESLAPVVALLRK